MTRICANALVCRVPSTPLLHEPKQKQRISAHCIESRSVNWAATTGDTRAAELMSKSACGVGIWHARRRTDAFEATAQAYFSCAPPTSRNSRFEMLTKYQVRRLRLGLTGRNGQPAPKYRWCGGIYTIYFGIVRYSPLQDHDIMIFLPNSIVKYGPREPWTR